MHSLLKPVATSILLAAVFGASAIRAQSVEPILFEETGTFRSGSLRESSGVGVSRNQVGILWTHNDSGDRAWIYATNMEGHDLGRFYVRGAGSVDWEDIAVGRCPTLDSGGDCLYVADTGDNDGRRRHGIVYIVREPDVTSDDVGSEKNTEPPIELQVTYQEGPRNVEALAVTPHGEILLVSKGSLGHVLLYSIPPHQISEMSVEVHAIDTLPIFPRQGFTNLVTAAAVSRNGSTLVIRTYTDLYFFELTVDGIWRLRGPPCRIGLRQPQGEAVDFIDEVSLVLTSESALGKSAGLARVVCPPGN